MNPLRKYLAKRAEQRHEREMNRDLDERLATRKASRKVHSRDTTAGMKREGSRWTAVNIELYETFCG